MADVFISYHEQSAGDIAFRIADALESAGISCWLAKRNMPLTVPFTEEIVREIENCKVFLLILNKQSLSSAHIASEIALAFERFTHDKSVTLIPFRVDDCRLSNRMFYYLNFFRIFDACPPNEERIQELTAEIAGILNLNRKKGRAAKAASKVSLETGTQ